MTTPSSTLPQQEREIAECSICGDAIDGLGVEIGKTVCFWCDNPEYRAHIERKPR